MTSNLFDRLEAALAASDIDSKLTLVDALCADSHAGSLMRELPAQNAEHIVRGHPARPLLVDPRNVPRRRANTLEGRAALIHAVAHIEYSAIDLALDHAFRFRDQPDNYYSDWIGVAADEARHFGMLRGYLRQLGFEYGDFPAHDSLWEMAVKTSADVLARMALVPRLLEARGLDATPPIKARLEQAGDVEGGRILGIILEDEVGHVALGDHWFRALCKARGLEPEAAYRELMIRFNAPWPQLPMNEKARREAGFGEAELVRLGQRLP